MNGILIITFAAMATVFDIKTRRIPNMLIAVMLGVWLTATAFSLLRADENAAAEIYDSMLGLLFGAGIFMSVYFISRKGLGGGDVKFMGAAGLYLGLGGTMPAILYGTALAALTGLILIAVKKITRKDKLPLAPFLLAGITLAVLIHE